MACSSRHWNSLTVSALTISRARSTSHLGADGLRAKRSSCHTFLPLRRITAARPVGRRLASTRLDAEESTGTSADTPAATKVPSKFNPFPFAYHQELVVTIETLTNRGWGIGRVALAASQTFPPDETDSSEGETIDSEQKWVVMVPNVIPGEVVRISVFRNFKNYSEADLVEVIEASSDRVQAVCPLSSECGGCQLQHMSIEAQRRWKTLHVEDGLKQYDLLTGSFTVTPTAGTDEVYGYRSKLTPHYQAPASSRRKVANDPAPYIKAIGFQQQTSRTIIDVPSCPIATPPVNDEYRRVREELLSKPPAKAKKGATLLLRQANIDDEYVTSLHKEALTTNVDGLSFTYLAGNFFQNNYYVLPLMVKDVVSFAKGTDYPSAITHLADCYCGSGLFALSAASQFETVVGIEINDKAVAEAEANALQNEISNCRFVAATAEGIFDQIADFPRENTAVVLDPPRKGCSEVFLEQLVAFGPRRIVYMSCDPTTQARDAQVLVAAGFQITHVQPYDLFPQTRHIECLMILERK